MRLIFEIGGIIYLFFTEPFLAICNIKGIGWIFKNFRRLLRKRREIQKTRIIKDNELFERGFITRSMRLTFAYTKSRISMFEAAK